MKTLNRLTNGEKAFIVDMQNSAHCEKLFQMGVFPGDMVEIKENHPHKNVIVVCINNNTFKIYRSVAADIITHVVNLEICLN